VTSRAASADVADDATLHPHHERHPLAVRVGLLLAVAVIALDQATKEIAETLLEPGEFVPLVGRHVGWQLIYNPGGAFGLAAPTWVFLAVTVVVVAIVLRALPRAPSLLQAAAFGLLLAGALGNLIDRTFRPGDPGFLGGWVVDFVAWGPWPRFNVADSAITVGVGLLFVALLREERAARRAERDLRHADAEPDEEREDPEAEPDDPGLGEEDQDVEEEDGA
jgi:signal peptidase II